MYSVLYIILFLLANENGGFRHSASIQLNWLIKIKYEITVGVCAE